MDLVRSKNGLTEDEDDVMQALSSAARNYGKLPCQHPDERRDFVDAIHRCQDLLAIRIARRHYPQGWPSYRPERHEGEQ